MESINRRRRPKCTLQGEPEAYCVAPGTPPRSETRCHGTVGSFGATAVPCSSHFIVWRATVSRWRTSSPACRYKLVVVNDACPRLSLTVRRSTPPSTMCEPAVWRNQCADARSSSSARSPNSGPRERNHAAAPRNTPLMASCTAERWRHRLAPLNGIKSGDSSEREGRGQRPFATRYRRSSLTRSAETGTIRSFSPLPRISSHH